MTIITYIVHSTTFDNEKAIVSGHYDCPLSPLGIEQAISLKEQIKEINLSIIYSSPLKRCIETANILFNSTKIIYDRRLMEINYGQFTHQAKKEVDSIRNLYIKQKFSEGESYLDVEMRMRSFIQDVYQHKLITIISHQAPQFALEVICNGLSWQNAIKNDWRLNKTGWKAFWIYQTPLMVR